MLLWRDTLGQRLQLSRVKFQSISSRWPVKGAGKSNFSVKLKKPITLGYGQILEDSEEQSAVVDLYTRLS